MKLHTLAAVALVAFLATAGTAAATSGIASHNAGEASGHLGPQEAENASPAVNDPAAVPGPDDSNATGGEDRGHGLASALPDQVPDRVSQLRDLIRQFRQGSLDGSLGEAISAVTGANDAPPAA